MKANQPLVSFQSSRSSSSEVSSASDGLLAAFRCHVVQVLGVSEEELDHILTRLYKFVNLAAVRVQPLSYRCNITLPPLTILCVILRKDVIPSL